MLGKGLESLIPQKGGQGGGTNDASSDGTNPNPIAQPAWRPQTNMNPQPTRNLSAGDPPPLDFPILPEELDLPSGENEEETNDDNAALREVAMPEEKPMVRPQVAAPVATSSDVMSQRFVKKESRPEPTPASEGMTASASVFQIEVEKIVPNPNQPRRVFDEDALKDLAHSIREFGILQPLVVTKVKKEKDNGMDVEYQLIAGERRLLASKLAGLKTVPAIIRNVDLEREKFELAIIENIQRENLNPVEVARAFERLRDEFKLTQREIAAKLGKSREVVANAVRLLDLPAYAQDALQRGQIQESTARFLLAVEDSGAQRKLFDEIVQNKLTARDVRERVRLITKRGRPVGSGATTVIVSPELKAIQDSLSAELGAPVEIEKRANDGKIMITFYSEEELEGILRKLGKNE